MYQYPNIKKDFTTFRYLIYSDILMFILFNCFYIKDQSSSKNRSHFFLRFKSKKCCWEYLTRSSSLYLLVFKASLFFF